MPGGSLQNLAGGFNHTTGPNGRAAALELPGELPLSPSMQVFIAKARVRRV
jgi:hypothetical protein